MDTNTPASATQEASPVIQETVPVRYRVNQDDLDRRFTYHPPKGDQASRYVSLREKAKELASVIMLLTPPTREQSLALTKLEEASMWANAAIARNE